MKTSIACRLVALVLGFCVLSSQDRLLQAQESVIVESNSATMEFPRTIQFKLSATAGAEINDVVLRYGTDGRSCGSSGGRQPMDVEPGTHIELAWEWDLEYSGILPHGVEVWWQWEISDTNGSDVMTERNTLLIDDNRYSFQRLSREQITVSWIEGDSTFGARLLDEALISLARIEADAGVHLEGDVSIVVYPSAADVQEALVHTTEWAGGVAFSAHNIVVVGIGPGQYDWAASVLPHELAHLVVGAQTFNCAGIWLPTWLSEGLADFAEGPASSAEVDGVELALHEGRLSNLRSLAYGFSAYGDSATLSYGQSRQVVAFMLVEFGPDKMGELLNMMQSGEIIDDALLATYGFDTDGLDSAWRISLGAEALPTPEVAKEEEMPTAVPTLPLVSLPIPSAPTPEPPTATPDDIPTTSATSTTAPTATATSRPTAAPTATNETPIDSALVTPDREIAIDSGTDEAVLSSSATVPKIAAVFGAAVLLVATGYGLVRLGGRRRQGQ